MHDFHDLVAICTIVDLMVTMVMPLIERTTSSPPSPAHTHDHVTGDWVTVEKLKAHRSASRLADHESNSIGGRID